MWLTGRSVALIATAALSLSLAFLAGIPALLYVTGLCAGLVVVALLLAVLARPRLEVRRTIEPAIVEPDEPVEVVVDLAVRSGVPVVTGRWRDRVPSTVLGTATGTVPVAQGSRVRIAYEVRGRRRGSHEVGPFSVVVGDAFGLVERSLSAGERDRFVVLPRRRALDVRGGPAGTTEGTTRLRATSGLGQDDVIARPYLPGDALKRWHWKATAHHGEPMVRQEESQMRPTMLVVLDADPRVHDHAGFEWSVSAAASVVAHYGERGFDVDLACGPSLVSLESGHGVQDALVTLALAEPDTAPLIVPSRERTTIVLSGALDSAAATRLVAAVPSRDTIAFVARSTTAEARSVLVAAGWHVVVRDSGDDLAATWETAMGVTSR
ncbi:DUF58 domain-containing protein [Aeromicrobium senzhongii]|uniref:DUF58 domain-containing protein n=1 Tax=Aeromicrobium senzhongii TaxID=2663859 RepID=A0ABX6SVN6_9ACTN|nr:DUF58 domain-containing protein [Aeromicrobium senzhongii]MTB87666.1 DUF58 domain-containing protein [Aeromicrobium senzhongii]QNL95302.1 DUF58 domain-containing protein [Aeromicrobium senzhongii]